MRNSNFARILPAVMLAGAIGSYTVSGVATAHAQTTASQDAPQDTSEQASPNGQRTDGQIEMDVVHTLDAAPELKQDWITAGTVQGEVTLSGTSATEANRQLAESLAAKVNGVAKVVNNLRVGDPQTAQGAEQYPDQGQTADQGQQQASADQGQQQASNENSAGQTASGQQQGTPQQPVYDSQQQPQNQPQSQNQRPAYGPPGQQGGYAPQAPRMAQAPEAPRAPVTLPQGTLLKVRTSEPLDSKRAKAGTPVEFTVVRDVYAAGVLAVPRGATVHGEIVDSKDAGALGGSPVLGLKLVSLDMEGNNYPLESDPFQVRGPNKAGRTAGNAFGGALLGAIIGGAVGGGSGAAIGAGAGAVGGTAASAATPGPRVWIPSEALMDFHLNAPVTVTPVSAMEAQRLASNAPPPSQRPTLYRRGPYPYRYGYPPPPPPPGYYPY